MSAPIKTRQLARSLLRSSPRLQSTSRTFSHFERPHICASCRLQNTQPSPHTRTFHNGRTLSAAPPPNKDRGPESTETTQTNFDEMNMLRGMPVPSTAIDECTNDGFLLDSGLRVEDGGVFLIAGQAFKWRPWIREGRVEGTIAAGGTGNDTGSAGGVGRVRNRKGQFDLPAEAWGMLDLVWPKPDLLIIGTGSSTIPLSPESRRYLNSLGIRLEVQDTRNAAAQFNLLATERGLSQIAAALIPYGWKDGR